MTIPASSDLEIPSGRPELIPLPHLATARQNNQEDESDSEGIIDLSEDSEESEHFQKTKDHEDQHYANDTIQQNKASEPLAAASKLPVTRPENGVTGDENENSSLWKRVEELAARLDGNVTLLKLPKERKRCVNCASTKRKIDVLEKNSRRLEETVEKQDIEIESLRKRLKSYEMYIAAQRSLMDTQTETIEELTHVSKIIALKRTNANPTTITEQAYRTIEKENMELKEELALSSTEMRKYQVWIDKHTDVINDYMSCIGLFSKADESSSFPTMRTPKDSSYVSDFIQHRLLDIKNLKVALDGKEKAERKITLIAESLHLELSRKSQLASESLRQVEALILSTQRMKQERDKAIENAEKAQRECAVQEFNNRTLTIEKESEAADITERLNEHLKMTRESYQFDRVKFQQQIDELMASKLELQVECRSFLKTNRELERELGEWKAKYESIIVNGELDLKTFKYNFPKSSLS